MKELLITGGLGFVGSYTIEKFKEDGNYNITIIDNLSSNVIDPADDIAEGCTVMVQDILKYDWNDSQKFDMIIHLASPVGPVGILKHAGNMGRMIIDELYWSMEGALKFDCPLIFISTSEIYGFRDHLAFLKEDDNKMLVGTFKVRNEYSMGKLLAEIILSNTAKVKTKLKYHIVRPFNISGPRQLKAGGFVLPTFFDQAFKSEPITVYLDGEQVRAFTHVKDIVKGIYLLVQEKVPYNQIWNIGTRGNNVSIKELAQMIKKKTGSVSEIIHVNPKDLHGALYEEAWDKVPDSSKIVAELGWNPEYELQDVIDEMYQYYMKKENL